jgi:hypothetical protein
LITPDTLPNANLEDGFLSLEGGVDSGQDAGLLGPTVAASATNITFRGGLPKPRPGITKLDLTLIGDDAPVDFATGLFQGVGGYVSLDGNPFLTLSISGSIYSLNLSSNSVTKLTTGNDPTLRKAWFAQADKYQIIQDNQSKPWIWDGASIRRATRTEVPAGGPTTYGLGRIAVATGSTYVMGNLIYGDAALGVANVLQFTDNDVINEGGSFTVPWQSGDITGLSFIAATDTAAGESDLMVGTRNGLFAFNAPTDRTLWRSLQQPIQRFALLKGGPSSHESMTQVNGDLFFRSTDGIRSYYLARRDWNTWVNTPVSNEVQQIVDTDDQYLLQWCSAVNFDNRLLTTVDPIMTNRGTIWRGLVALDFDLVSGITKRNPPCWDGRWDFPSQILQFVTIQNVSGVRSFVVGMDETETISVWEITVDKKKDDDDSIDAELITRSFQFEKPTALKKLDTADLWFSKLEGNVSVDAYYRADQRECWNPWGRWEETVNICQSAPNRALGCKPVLFPRPQVRSRVSLPSAPVNTVGACGGEVTPSNLGYEFQVRLNLTGSWKLRRFRVRAQEAVENEFGTIQNDCTTIPLTECETCDQA